MVTDAVRNAFAGIAVGGLDTEFREDFEQRTYLEKKGGRGS